jgi:3',5'-cyclic AMP phosphodiesterase CpdA
MMKLRIALISDLHVGAENRGMDMCPHPLLPDEVSGRCPDYVATIEQQASEFKEKGDIDMLCVTGDISNRAHAEEFKLADRAIERVANALSIPKTSVYFVPGNHDIYWPVMELNPHDFWAPYRYAPLLQNGLTFQRRISESQFGAIDCEPYFIAWKNEKSIVLGINSAAFDGPTAATHSGVIRQETIHAIDTFLKELPVDFSQTRVCLLHHHPIQYSEKIPNSVDLSIAVNSENLINVLNKHSFDLILHGHKHQPRLKTHLINNCHPFVSLCAGSFSSILHPLHFDGSSNLFHIMNIDGRDQSSKGIQGTLQSWTYTTEGIWKPSHENRGIPAVEAFGSLATPTQIKTDLKNTIPNLMIRSTVCKWTDLVSQHPHLDFVNSNVAFKLMSEVAHELGCEMVGDNNGYSRNWVVFRRIA